MAESIVKLKVESREYENKLQRATEGLKALERSVRSGGDTFRQVWKEEIQFTQALGKMETASTTARGKLAELTKAYTELSTQYNRLTDDEKRSPFGKALESSLGQLKGRIQDSKKELDNISKSLNGSSGLSGALDTLAGKFGLNITQLGVFGTAMAAATGALKVAQEAFFASEANVDEWGRIVSSAESTWNSFLNSINTGDIGGFLSRIDDIVNAARQAYDELDRLGTQKTINSPRLNAQQAENERFRAMLRTGRYIAPNDGRRATMKEGQVLTKEQKDRIAQQLQNGMKNVNGIVKDEITQITKAINALYNRQAKELGMSTKEFRAGTANMAEFDKRIAGYNQYKSYEAKRDNVLAKANSGHSLTDKESALIKSKNPYEQYKAWGTFRVDGDRYKKLVDLIGQRSAQQSQNYAATAQGYRSINTATKTTGSSGTTISTKAEATRLQELDKAISDLNKELEGNPTADRILEIKAALDALNGEKFSIEQRQRDIADGGKSIKGVSVLDTYVNKQKADRDNYLKEEGTKYRDGWGKKDKEPKSWNAKNTGIEEQIKDSDGMKVGEKLTNGLSEISSGINALGIELPEGLENIINTMSGIMSIVNGVASIMSITEIFDKTNGTTQTSLLTSIQGTLAYIAVQSSIPFFSHGGVVPQYAATGKSFARGTDTIPAMLSPGETVLTRAQAGNLASQLNDTASARNMQLSATIHGEDIRLALNNNSRRRGRGEYVTSKSA